MDVTVVHLCHLSVCCLWFYVCTDILFLTAMMTPAISYRAVSDEEERERSLLLRKRTPKNNPQNDVVSVEI